MNKTFEQKITISELWFLAQLFAPGIIWGFDDLTKGLDDEAVQALQKKAKDGLIKKNLLIEEEQLKFKMDEMLGGMMYSCVNADLVIQVKDTVRDEALYLYLMKDWLLSANYLDEDVELCLYQNEDVLFSELFGASPSFKKGDQAFDVPALGLEMCVSLLEEDDDASLNKLIATMQIETELDRIGFIKGYTQSDFNFGFNSVRKNDAEEKISYSNAGVVAVENQLFWFEKERASEDEAATIKFEQIDEQDFKDKFERLIRI